MNKNKRTFFIVALSSAMALPLSGYAQSAMQHGATESPASASMTNGEIRKIDPAAGTVTIKHEDIKNLQMPGMTMVFPVKNRSALTNFKPGDKVKFVANKENGKVIVTDIEPAQ